MQNQGNKPKGPNAPQNAQSANANANPNLQAQQAAAAMNFVNPNAPKPDIKAKKDLDEDKDQKKTAKPETKSKAELDAEKTKQDREDLSKQGPVRWLIEALRAIFEQMERNPETGKRGASSWFQDKVDKVSDKIKNFKEEKAQAKQDETQQTFKTGAQKSLDDIYGALKENIDRNDGTLKLTDNEINIINDRLEDVSKEAKSRDDLTQNTKDGISKQIDAFKAVVNGEAKEADVKAGQQQDLGQQNANVANNDNAPAPNNN